jgi:hypothetical protein
MKNDMDFHKEELENMINQINVPMEYVNYMIELLDEKFNKLDDDGKNIDDETFEEDLYNKMKEKFPDMSDYYFQNTIKYINILSMLFELNNMINNAEGDDDNE